MRRSLSRTPPLRLGPSHVADHHALPHSGLGGLHPCPLVCRSALGARGGRGRAGTWVLYTMRSRAVASTPLGVKHGSAFSPESTTPLAAAPSRTCHRPPRPLSIMQPCAGGPPPPLPQPPEAEQAPPHQGCQLPAPEGRSAVTAARARPEQRVVRQHQLHACTRPYTRCDERGADDAVAREARKRKPHLSVAAGCSCEGSRGRRGGVG